MAVHLLWLWLVLGLFTVFGDARSKGGGGKIRANRRSTVRSVLGGIGASPFSKSILRARAYERDNELPDIETAKKIIQTISPQNSLNDASDDVARAVASLIKQGESNGVSISNKDWFGRWHVIYAPHIRTLSKVLLGTKFDVEYVIKDEKTEFGPAIQSNVRYENPILGKGWLCSSGTVRSDGESDALSVVSFRDFWLSFGENPPNSKPDMNSGLRSVVNSLGRAGFIEDFSQFPVLYLDSEFCVFKFPLLDVTIAARKEAL
ncbi:hypothetical protein AAMO2058_001392900 [Amorphochlora amoebiformis]